MSSDQQTEQDLAPQPVEEQRVESVDVNESTSAGDASMTDAPPSAEAPSTEGESAPEFSIDATPQSAEHIALDEPKEEDGPPKRLFIRPIRDETSLEDVEALFGTHGEISDISLKPGYGFVEFKTAEEAAKAVESLNGSESFGYSIMVEPAMARPKRDESREFERKPIAKYRLEVEGPTDVFSWQDLKDLARTKGVEAVFTKVVRDNTLGLVDVSSIEDRDTLIQMSGQDWMGGALSIREDPRGPPPPFMRGRGRGGFRGGRGGRGGFRGGRGGFRGGRGGFRGDRFGDRSDRFSRDRYDGSRARSPPREPTW